jgi:type I restriction enzyme S subunit
MLKEFAFPLPPLPEQRRIVAYLDQIQSQVTAFKRAQEATETELHRLEQAILDKAFRGEL